MTLIERIEAAEVGSRELDAAVFRHFGQPLPDQFASLRLDLDWQADGSALMAIGEMNVRYDPPTYTTSIDAAVALAGRVLPGWVAGIMQNRGREVLAWSAYLSPPNPAELDEVEAHAHTPALALVASILRARGE